MPMYSSSFSIHESVKGGGEWREVRENVHQYTVWIPEERGIRI